MTSKYDKLCTEIQTKKTIVDNKIEHWYDESNLGNVSDCERHIINQKQEVLDNLTEFIESLNAE